MIVTVAVLILLGSIWAGLCAWMASRHPEPLWDWDSIDVGDLRFPDGFLWGSATASHQVDGGNDNNNWYRWEHSVDEQGRPRVHNGDRSGSAVEHWERYPEDIRRMRDDLGLRSYRFSIEWSRVEPRPGEFDPEAIAHYHDVIETLIDAGIEPMITLHHFTNPLWFEDRGGFEEEENIALFVRFSTRMFEEYGERVKRWCTINESGPYAVMGYGLGVFPPGVKNYQRMAVVLYHLMRAHTAVYDAIKAMPGGDSVEVGLVKNIFQFDPHSRWNLFHWAFCRVADGAYNQSIIGYLQTGRFKVRIPFLANLDRNHPEDAMKSDFVGLNYYSNLILSLFMKREPPFEPHSRPGQVLTDMPYTVYAEGFYGALMRLKPLGLPIIVTENGIADDRDDRRALWIRRYLYAMSCAIRDGADVRGYHYWTLIDNFEWAEGWQMSFGLYENNRETQERRLREGSLAYRDIVAEWSERV
jgi:beta-glucosidase